MTARLVARWFYTTVAVLGLLTLATSASAACAWVLWYESLNLKTRETEVGIDASYTSGEACIKEIASKLESNLRDKDGALTRTAQTEATGFVQIGKTNYHVTYRCLPDTIDPRGPKGK